MKILLPCGDLDILAIHDAIQAIRGSIFGCEHIGAIRYLVSTQIRKAIQKHHDA